MKLKSILIAGALLALAAFAPAQGFRGGGRQMNNPTFLLRRADVQEELKLSDEQKTKLTEIQDSLMQEGRAAMQDAQGDREAMGKIWAKLGQKSEEQVKAVLTADQWKRLKEVGIQIAGNGAVMNPEVAKAINLTDDQSAKIKELNKVVQEGSQALREKQRSGELTQEDVQAKMKANRKVLNDKIGEILTADQRAKLKEMGGAPFEQKDEGNRG